MLVAPAFGQCKQGYQEFKVFCYTASSRSACLDKLRVSGDWKMGEEKKTKGKERKKKTVGTLRFQDGRKTHYACWKPGYFHGDVNTAVFQKVAQVFPKPAQHLPQRSPSVLLLWVALVLHRESLHHNARLWGKHALCWWVQTRATHGAQTEL